MKSKWTRIWGAGLIIALLQLLFGLALPGAVRAAPGFAPALDRATGTPLNGLTDNPAVPTIGTPTFYANSPHGLRVTPVFDATGVARHEASPGVPRTTGTAIRKFVDDLPLPGRGAGLTLKREIPAAVAQKWTTPDGVVTNDDYYEIACVEYTEQLHSDFGHPTVLRGYVQLASPGAIAAWAKAHGGAQPATYPLFYLDANNLPDSTRPIQIQATNADGTLKFSASGPVMVQAVALSQPHFLGPLVQAVRGTATRFKFLNLLPAGRATVTRDPVTGAQVVTRNGDLFLPVDETLTGSGFGPDLDALFGPAYATKYTQNRASVHLHGGDNPWISDGTPQQWIAPAGETDQANPASVTATYLANANARQALVTAGKVAPAVPVDTTVAGAGPWLRGASAMNVPDMADPGPGAMTLYYPNNQSARLLWYHDHTVGLTRVNVYSGMAAPYVLREAGVDVPDSTGQSLITAGVLPADEIPLIIQDHTFVPDDIDLQDSKWDAAGWGKPGGDMWFPHVYETTGTSTLPAAVLDAAVQADPAGLQANPAGRWDYGPELNGTPSLYGALLPPDGSRTIDPFSGLANVSTTPEAFMDTVLVNGVVYPKLAVDPKAYRLRVLNASNDRFLNLGFYVADGAQDSAQSGTARNTEVRMIPARPQCLAGQVSTLDAPCASVQWPVCSARAVPDPVTGLPRELQLDANNVVLTGANGLPLTSTCLPDTWQLDNRNAGLPDPDLAGPPIVQIGNEGGFLPTPRHIPSTPVSYGANQTALGDPLAQLNNVASHGLVLTTAGRADLVVDFAQFACRTLILYNDSPAPFPGADDRYDYYTGAGDLSYMGGSETTQPGFGPNTRTLLQVNVGAPAGATCLNGVAVDASGAPVAVPPFVVNDARFAQVFTDRKEPALADFQAVAAAIKDRNGATYRPNSLTTPADVATLPTIDPQLALDASRKPQFDAAGVALTTTVLPVQHSAIVEEFDPNFGRLNALFGVVTDNGPMGQSYADAVSEKLTAGAATFWRITHQGIDTHPVHIHLTNVQVVARVLQDGTVVPPLPEEEGWKETVQMNPAQDIILAMKPEKPLLNGFGVPNSVRSLDPSQPAGVTTGFTQIDPVTGVSVASGAPPVTNLASIDFNWEYVWHCHILGHEENDFMRTISFDPLETATAAPLVSVIPVKPVSLTFTDQASNEFAYVVVRQDKTAGSVPVEIYRGPARTGTGTQVTIADPGATMTTTTYTVTARGAVHDGVTAISASLADLQPVTQLTATGAARSVSISWTSRAVGLSGYQVERCTGTLGQCSAKGYTVLSSLPAGATTTSDSGLLPVTTYTYRITPEGDTSVDPTAFGVPATVQVTTAAELLAPTALTATATAARNVNLAWVDNATGEANYLIERCAGTVASCGTTGFTVLQTLAANLLAAADATVLPNTSYTYRVTAITGTASGTPALVSVTTPIELLAPTTPTATASAAGITLAWGDASSGETAYKVERCAGTNTATICGAATAAWSVLNSTLAANTVSYLDGTAVAATSYTYRVSALSTVNAVTTNGPLSALVTATGQVAVAAPGSLVATSTNGTSVVLTWVDNSTNEASFSVERGTLNTANGTTTWPAAALAAVARTGTLVAATGGSVTYTDTTAVLGTTYVYRVSAATAAPVSTSAPSAEVQFALSMSAPSGLTATGASGTAVALSWTDTSANESGFEVQRSADNGLTWTALGATQPTVVRTAAQTTSVNTAVTYSDATAALNVTYWYRVRAVNATALAQSVWSGSASTTLTLAAPGNLMASLGAVTAAVAPASSTQAVLLSWTDNANNETAYQVQRAVVTNGVTAAFTALATQVTRTAALKTAVGGAVTYTDSTALLNTTYAYQVVAVNTSAAPVVTTLSAPSTALQINTSGTPTASTAPSAFTISVASGVSVVLNWVDSSTTETSFAVMRWDAVTNLWTQVGTVARTAAQTKAVNTATTYTDATAAIGTAYQYRVDAIVPAPGVTLSSAVLNAQLLVADPVNATAAQVANSSSILISWTDASNNETSFEVDRIDPAGARVTFTVTRTAALKTAVNGAVTYTDATAAPGVTYTYVVRAVNLTGTVRTVSHDVATNPTQITTPGMTAPGVPTAAVASATSIKVTWTDLSTNETGFVLERSVDGGATFTVLVPNVTVARTAAQATSVNAAVTYTDTLVAPVVQGTYVYRVKSVQHTGTGTTAVITAASGYAQSQALNFTAPAAPTAITAVAGTTAGTVNLTWVDNSNNEAGFTVQYATNATFTTGLKTVTVPSANVTSTTIAGLVSKTAYFFRVQATNLVGASAYASTTVAVAAP